MPSPEIIGDPNAAGRLDLRVVLFGSAARGEQQANSDVDLMVVMPDGFDRRGIAHSARRDHSDRS